MSIFIYIYALIFPIGNWIKDKADVEISRKVIHIMLILVWCLIEFFFRNTIHQIIIPVVFIALNTLSYRYHIYRSVEREEINHKGTIYFAVAISAIMITSYFYPSLFLSGGAAIVCLTTGDGTAAIIGYRYQSRSIRSHKSLYGTLACFISSAFGLIIYKLIYKPTFLWSDIVIISAIASVLELTENGFDNITMTCGVFIITGMLCHSADIVLRISLIIAITIFFVVFLSKAITYAGSIVSFLIVFAFSYFGGSLSILYLLGSYFTIFIIGVIKKKKIKINNSPQIRNVVQIVVNGCMGTIFIILYGLSKERRFLVLSLIGIGGCFIDSIASDIGTISKKPPYDFIRKKAVPPGISGGISMLGTFSALAFSIILLAFSYIIIGLRINESILIGGASFAQSILDTVFGSLIQAKYQCVECNMLIETEKHCGQYAHKISGLRWVNNNTVNLLSSCSVTLFSILLL